LCSGKFSSLGHWLLDSSGMTCVREIFVTWPLDLGLIRNDLRLGNIRHLTIGSWTYPKRLAFGKYLSLGHWLLIRNDLRSRDGLHRHWSHSDMLPSPYEVLPILGLTALVFYFTGFVPSAFLSLLVSRPLLLGRTFGSEGADVRRVPEMYTTDALASS
nr:hypothetical protein [Tanacetum cinerariifolium]